MNDKCLFNRNRSTGSRWLCLIIVLLLILPSCSALPRMDQTATQQSTVEDTYDLPSGKNDTGLPVPSTAATYFYQATSPDGRFTVGLKLDQVPVTLTITNHDTNQITELSLTNRSYNHLVGEDPEALVWSQDNKVVMFVIYRALGSYSPEFVQDSSCFYALDVENAKLITVNYSSMIPGVWWEDEYGMTTLEHGGKNNIFDFYYRSLDCYIDWEFGECTGSSISPSGNWELLQWQPGADVVLVNLSGQRWSFSYPKMKDDSGFDQRFGWTSVEKWSDDERFIYFNTSLDIIPSYHYYLYQMDLTTGKTVLLSDHDVVLQDSFSVSPHARTIAYITDSNNLVILDTLTGTRRNRRVPLQPDETMANFRWSPDGTRLIFNTIQWDRNNTGTYLDVDRKMVSADYVILEIDSTRLRKFDGVNFLDATFTGKYDSELWLYLNIIKITNLEFYTQHGVFSLDGGLTIY
jgi:Tol biopolymer transport system component